MKYWMAWCVPGKWGHDKWMQTQTVGCQHATIMFLMAVLQESVGFYSVRSSVTFPSMWVRLGGYSPARPSVWSGESVSSCVRCTVRSVTRSTLELNSFIIETAVSTHVCHVSTFIQVEKKCSRPSSGLFQIYLMFKESRIKVVDQRSPSAIKPARYLMQTWFSLLKESRFRRLCLPKKTCVVPFSVSFLFLLWNLSFYSHFFDQI